MAKWRGLAQRHEAAFGEAAAKLHSREAASLAASTQQQVCGCSCGLLGAALHERNAVPAVPAAAYRHVRLWVGSNALPTNLEVHPPAA